MANRRLNPSAASMCCVNFNWKFISYINWTWLARVCKGGACAAGEGLCRGRCRVASGVLRESRCVSIRHGSHLDHHDTNSCFISYLHSWVHCCHMTSDPVHWLATGHDTHFLFLSLNRYLTANSCVTVVIKTGIFKSIELSDLEFICCNSNKQFVQQFCQHIFIYT